MVQGEEEHRRGSHIIHMLSLGVWVSVLNTYYDYHYDIL